MSTFWRYLRIQAFVLLCGIVGPIFLVVYFAMGADPVACEVSTAPKAPARKSTT